MTYIGDTDLFDHQPVRFYFIVCSEMGLMDGEEYSVALETDVGNPDKEPNFSVLKTTSPDGSSVVKVTLTNVDNPTRIEVPISMDAETTTSEEPLNVNAIIILSSGTVNNSIPAEVNFSFLEWLIEH